MGIRKECLKPKNQSINTQITTWTRTMHIRDLSEKLKHPRIVEQRTCSCILFEEEQQRASGLHNDSTVHQGKLVVPHVSICRTHSTLYIVCGVKNRHKYLAGEGSRVKIKRSLTLNLKVTSKLEDRITNLY